MIRFRHDRKGFTLIEIIIALAILGIIFIAFLTAFGSSYTTIFGMGHRTRAMAQAQELIDIQGYDQLVNYGNDCQAMLTDPFVSGVDDIGRYCIQEDAFTISQWDASLTDRSYNMVTVLVFYPNRSDYVTLTHYTRMSP